MKWFKHLSGSLDDSFIFDLIDKFGGDGYLVFFGTLEIISKEFDVNSPGICQLSKRFLAKKFQLSIKKTLDILKFCEKNERIFITNNDDLITLNCPKLKKLCDEFTQRILKARLKVNPDKIVSDSNPRSRSKKKEVDKEEEVDTHIGKNSVCEEKVLLDKFKELFKKDNKQEYIVKDKDSKLANKLIKELGLKESIRRMENCFKYDYWFGKSRTFGHFVEHINDLINEPGVKKHKIKYDEKFKL